MAATIRIVQLSDTHFLEEGADPEGGHAYDTDAAFEAVLGDIGDQSGLDLVVVTGDIADHGRVGQYQKAATQLSRFSVPVNACPGNHDFDKTFTAAFGRPGVSSTRMVEIGSWAFLFVDSSAGMMTEDDSGLLVDPPGEQRLHNDGVLGTREAAWIKSMCETTTADHVFIWLHHPPGVPVPMSHDEAYAAVWLDLLPRLAKVRGMGAGHTHIPAQYDLLDIPVFVSPALKNNFSLEDRTWLPPGYRSYEFASDGTVQSTVHLVDDDRWPRSPFGRALHSLFMGEITFEQLRDISARRAGQK